MSKVSRNDKVFGQNTPKSNKIISWSEPEFYMLLNTK